MQACFPITDIHDLHSPRGVASRDRVVLVVIGPHDGLHGRQIVYLTTKRGRGVDQRSGMT